MTIAVKQTELFVQNLHARMPFRYGLATLERVPHLILRATCEVDGRPHVGYAADTLPPKWFVKRIEDSYRHEVADMLHVIESACGFAEQLGEHRTAFDLWQAVYAQQMRWATGEEDYPPLLWNFGVSFIERAAIDAACRAAETPFAAALRDGTLGIKLSEIHKPLAEFEPKNLLPQRPLNTLAVRHTVGLTDPITDGEIDPGARLDDGLPQSLEAAIDAYGLRWFKIKLTGSPEDDAQRLAALASLFERKGIHDFRFTLDANENYMQLVTFRELWEQLVADAVVGPFLKRMICVEQPLHRDVAMSMMHEEEVAGWEGRPPMIIDESDDRLDALPEALEAGYVGTAHKNCKGVFKGVANACLLEYHRRSYPDLTYLMTAEDLATVGPVAMPQDTAVVASLGIPHAERNGHHYFRGLEAFPEPIQTAALDAHGDLYRAHDAGFPVLNIVDGQIATGSITAAPFGLAAELDLTALTPLDRWRFDSLGLDEETQ